MRFNKICVALLAVIAACGCTDDKKKARDLTYVPIDQVGVQLKVDLQPEELAYYGDTLLLSVSVTQDSLKVESFAVILANENETVMQNQAGTAYLPTQLIGGGEIRLKIEAKLTNGKTAIRYKELRVLSAQPERQWTLEVLRKYPHDNKSYTQGLLMHGGFLYEGTGNYGQSRIRKLELETGKVLQEKEIASSYFGEGITIFDDKLYQLTYKSGQGFIYSLSTFDQLGSFNYNFETGEGWGLTNDSNSLIASDGSPYLYYLNPTNLQIEKRLQVFDSNGSISRLNELEYLNGVIYANVYTTAKIMAIDATTGQVLDVYSAAGLVDRSDATSDMDVLNGIAINPLNGHLLLTGKYWKRIYEVKPVMLKASS